MQRTLDYPPVTGAPAPATDWTASRLFDRQRAPRDLAEIRLAASRAARRPDAATILHGPVRAPDSAARRWRRKLVLLWTERALGAAMRRSRKSESRIRRARRRRDAARVAYHAARGML